MQIARLQNDKSIAELATRVYGLKPDDPRTAAAGKALVAANPHLSGNLAALPAGTPVIVPAAADLNASATTVTDPNQAAWITVLEKLVESAQQASNAQTTGLATKRPESADPQRTKALTQLRTDIAQFKKLHTS
jgi:phage tail protein X